MKPSFHRSRPARRAAIVALIVSAFALGVFPSAAARADDRVVIPFDWESKFPRGGQEEKMGDMIWTKLKREGGFVIPETMLDVRDFCKENRITVSADTPLDDMKAIVVDQFGADIGIWGSVAIVGNHEGDVYDITIKCVDFTASSSPHVIFEKTGRTKVVSEIPHVYVKEMLDALYERPADGDPLANPYAEANWEKNPNLVRGGDFQQGARGVPTGWEPRGGQYREPLGDQVRWLPEAGGDADNRVVRLTFPESVGNSEGVMYYSHPFPIEEGATYRFQCRWRTNGPTCKVFIKCYGTMKTEYLPEGVNRGAPARGSDYVAEGSQKRECYRAQFNLKGDKNTWNTHTQDFTPKHTKYTPTEGRVMLYGYLGGGVVEYDDVIIKQIIPASPSEGKKDPRHSLESTVTIEEMEENERGAED